MSKRCEIVDNLRCKIIISMDICVSGSCLQNIRLCYFIPLIRHGFAVPPSPQGEGFGSAMIRRPAITSPHLIERCGGTKMFQFSPAELVCSSFALFSEEVAKPSGRCVAQRIKILMIAGGNHTIIQTGKNDNNRTGHASGVGPAHRYRAGSGTNDTVCTMHEIKESGS